MSQHFRKCGCKSDCNPPCGCTDSVFAMKSSCEAVPECFNPEKCSETFSTDCIYYGGDSIANIGLPKGTRLTDVIQLLINLYLSPGCTLPTSPCLSVIGIGSTIITQTSATIVWSPVVGATTYTLEYSTGPTGPFTPNAATVNTYDSVGGLQPATNYYLRVTTMCGQNSCYSNTILITTKS